MPLRSGASPGVGARTLDMRAPHTRDFVGWAIVFALSVAVGGGVGCSGARQCPTYPHTDGAKVLRYHASMRSHARTLRGEARVEQRGAEGRVKGTIWMLVDAQGRLRIDVMTQFGPVATLTSDGQYFALTDLKKKKFVRGPACPRNIARFVGLEMRSDDLARVLLGGTPLIANAKTSLECRDGVYQVDLAEPVRGVGAVGEVDPINPVDPAGRRQRVTYEVRAYDRQSPPIAQRLRLKRSTIWDARNKPVWEATYGDYVVIAAPHGPAPSEQMGVAFPREVRVRDARGELRIEFRSIELNVELADEAFVQTPAPGLIIEEAIDCS
jgi:hypothetical protein